MRAVSSRSFAASFVLVALSLAGCSSDDEAYYARRHPDDHDVPPCAMQTSCGTCTPVLGCGWCQYDDGTGACTTSPSRCKGDTFRWAWEPSTCSIATGGDAGSSDADPIPADASEEAAVSDAGDAGEEAPDAAETSTDAPACVVPDGTAPCVVTTGGSLCGAGQYTLGCHASDGEKPVPAAALKCTSALDTGGSTYWCCSCAGD